MAAFTAFGIITVAVVSGVTARLDASILTWLGTHRSTALTNGMLDVTYLGNGAVEVPFALASALVLFRLNRDHALRYVLACTLGEAVYALIKALVHRARPTIIEQLGSAGWYSYPSGHSMLAPIIYSLALVLFADATSNRSTRTVCWTLALIIPPSVAFSRVYLGVHYPSDVLGALSLGIGWAALWRGERSSSSAASASAAPAIS